MFYLKERTSTNPGWVLFWFFSSGALSVLICCLPSALLSCIMWLLFSTLFVWRLFVFLVWVLGRCTGKSFNTILLFPANTAATASPKPPLSISGLLPSILQPNKPCRSTSLWWLSWDHQRSALQCVTAIVRHTLQSYPWLAVIDNTTGRLIKQANIVAVAEQKTLMH